MGLSPAVRVAAPLDEDWIWAHDAENPLLARDWAAELQSSRRLVTRQHLVIFVCVSIKFFSL